MMTQRLSPNRTAVTSFAPRRPADASSAFIEGDWILCAAASPSGKQATVSLALSNGEVQILDQDRLHNVTTLFPGRNDFGGGQASLITDLAYGPQHSLVSAGQDGRLFVSDLRSNNTLREALPGSAGTHPESALSVSLGYDGYLAAVGSSKGRIHFFDLRAFGGSSNKQSAVLGSYVNSHCAAVAEVAFHPVNRSLLLSGAEDGLLCSFDTTQPTEELAVKSVINVGTPLRHVGWAGEAAYCLTGSETASIWNVETTICVQNFGNLRNGLSSLAGRTIDYLVDAHWDAARQTLFLAAGTNTGDVALCTCKQDRRLSLQGDPLLQSSLRWEVSYLLSGGHRGVVRDWCPLSGGLAGKQVLLMTAGEDARLCEWKSATNNSNSFRAVASSSGAQEELVSCRRPSGGGGPVRRKPHRHKPTACPY